MATKSNLKTAQQVLDRFYREAEGRTNRQIDVYFVLRDLEVDPGKGTEALEFLVSRGLINTFGPDIAFLTERGAQVVIEDSDIASLPKVERDFEQVRPAAEPARPAAEPAKPAAKAESKRPPRATLTHIAMDGKEFTLELGWLCGIGRAEGNEVRVNDQRASKRHAEIRFEDGRYVLYDLQSANGTLVNGEYIGETHVLHHDDEVVIGRTMLLYQSPKVLARPAGPAPGEPAEELATLISGGGKATERPGPSTSPAAPPSEGPIAATSTPEPRSPEEPAPIRVVKGRPTTPAPARADSGPPGFGATPGRPAARGELDGASPALQGAGPDDLFGAPPRTADPADLFGEAPPPPGDDLFGPGPATPQPSDLFDAPSPRAAPRIAPSHSGDDLFATEPGAGAGRRPPEDLFDDAVTVERDDLFAAPPMARGGSNLFDGPLRRPEPDLPGPPGALFDPTPTPGPIARLELQPEPELQLSVEDELPLEPLAAFAQASPADVDPFVPPDYGFEAPTLEPEAPTPILGLAEEEGLTVAGAPAAERVIPSANEPPDDLEILEQLEPLEDDQDLWAREDTPADGIGEPTPDLEREDEGRGALDSHEEPVDGAELLIPPGEDGSTLMMGREALFGAEAAQTDAVAAEHPLEADPAPLIEPLPPPSPRAVSAPRIGPLVEDLGNTSDLAPPSLSEAPGDAEVLPVATLSLADIPIPSPEAIAAARAPEPLLLVLLGELRARLEGRGLGSPGVLEAIALLERDPEVRAAASELSDVG